jgi:DHA2 family multidrug resistance protein
MLSTLMMTLDSTIANVALPHIQGSVSASQSEAVWVLTSYMVASAIMTPLGGWLSERIGRKRMLILSVGGFTFASMLCGVATSLPELVAFRALQGLAGATLMPLSQTVMLDIFPQDMLPRMMSLWAAVIVLGPIIGPTLGGWITENWNWRWVFYINVPIGAVAMFVYANFMGRDEGGRARPFDFLGFGALCMFMLGLQVLLDRGTEQDWFNSPEIWIEAIIALVGLYVFVVHTLTAKHPFFDRDLTKDGNFVVGVLISFCHSAIFFSTNALLPTFMQNLLGYSAFQSGLTAMPRGMGSLLVFFITPWMISRFGARTMLWGGVVLGVISTWSMSRFDLYISPRQIMAPTFIQGMAMAFMFTPLTTLTFATLTPAHRAEGTVVFTLLRNIGSAAGISVMQTMLFRESALAHARMADKINPADPMLRATAPAWRDPGVLNAEVTRQASMVSYVDVFAWMTLAILFLIPLILIMKPPPVSAVRTEVAAE